MRTLQSTVLSGLANNILRLIVLPTESCNFRCTYCYEDFEHGRMPSPLVDGLKLFIARRAADLDVLTLSWFGGEPLLARDLVEEVMEHAQALAGDRPALSVRSDMTTNGYLLGPAVFERLVRLGVRKYQISLDGARACHDETRVRAGGAGTFERIWANLQAMRSLDLPFQVLLRIHVHPGNLQTLPTLLNELAQLIGAEPRFRVVFKELSALGGPGDASFAYLGRQETKTVRADLERRARAVGLNVARLDGGVCYAARGNAFVVRSDGRINKCTVALEHPANQVGHLQSDGRLELRGEMIAPWMRGVASLDADALHCPMRGLADPAHEGQVSLSIAS